MVNEKVITIDGCPECPACKKHYDDRGPSWTACTAAPAGVDVGSVPKLNGAVARGCPLASGTTIRIQLRGH